MEDLKKIRTAVYGLNKEDTLAFIENLSNAHKDQITKKNEQISLLQQQINTLNDNLRDTNNIVSVNESLTAQINDLNAKLKQSESQATEIAGDKSAIQQLNDRISQLETENSSLRKLNDSIYADRVKISNALIHAENEAARIIEQQKEESDKEREKLNDYILKEYERLDVFSNNLKEIKRASLELLQHYAEELGLCIDDMSKEKAAFVESNEDSEQL